MISAISSRRSASAAFHSTRSNTGTGSVKAVTSVHRRGRINDKPQTSSYYADLVGGSLYRIFSPEARYRRDRTTTPSARPAGSYPHQKLPATPRTHRRPESLLPPETSSNRDHRGKQSKIRNCVNLPALCAGRFPQKRIMNAAGGRGGGGWRPSGPLSPAVELSCAGPHRSGGP